MRERGTSNAFFHVNKGNIKFSTNSKVHLNEMESSIDPSARDSRRPFRLYLSSCHPLPNPSSCTHPISPHTGFLLSPLWSLSHFPPALSSVSICSCISPSSPVLSLLSVPITLPSNCVTAPVSCLRVTTWSSAELPHPTATKVGSIQDQVCPRRWRLAKQCAVSILCREMNSIFSIFYKQT